MRESISFLAIFFVVFVSGCARSERAILDEAESLMNQRKYGEAIQLLEKEMKDHSSTNMKTQLGFAYLGLSGVELLEIAKNVTYFKGFNITPSADSGSKKGIESLEKECPIFPFTTFDFPNEPYATDRIVCLPFFRINGFPKPDNPNLNKGLAILIETYPDPSSTSQEINLFIAIVQMGVAIGSYDFLLHPPEQYLTRYLDRVFQIEYGNYYLRYFKSSINSFLGAFKRLLFSYGKIRRFFSKFEGKPLLTIGSYTYYGSSQISAEDFFNFLVESGRDEIQTKGKDAEGKSMSVRKFSYALLHGLSFLRLRVNGAQENFLNEHFFRLVHLGSHVFPERMTLADVRSSNFRFSFETNPLPKSAKRLVESIKGAWKQENSVLLYDAYDDLLSQHDQYIRLTLAWDDFWRNLDSASRMDLRVSLDILRLTIPVFEINPNGPINFIELQKWYTYALQEMHRWSEDMTRQSSSHESLAVLPNLIFQTEAWVTKNLW